MVTVLLHDWKYFEGMNEVFEESFGQKPPARSTIRGERWPDRQIPLLQRGARGGPIAGVLRCQQVRQLVVDGPGDAARVRRVAGRVLEMLAW